MLETTLDQLEKLVSELVQQNQNLHEHCALLEQQLQSAREENDNLQLAALEQEERMASVLSRLQGLVQRSGTSGKTA